MRSDGEMAWDEYKLEKEAFVSGLSGSEDTMELIALVLLAPLSIVLCSLVQGEVLKKRSGNILFTIVLELILIPVSILFGVLNPSWLYLLVVVDLILIALLLSIGRRLNSVKSSLDTFFRSSIMLMTVLCILAVDFQLFPRRFAKTEVSGISLMDLGAGYFVVLNGFSYSPSRTSFKPCLLFLLLGGFKAVVHSSVEYQTHVSEYGVHWNFFLTLSVLHFFSSALSFSRFKHFGLLGAFILLVHENALSNGLSEYIIQAPRVDLISANKEGVFGTFALFGLFCLAVEVRYWMRICQPSILRSLFILVFSSLLVLSNYLPDPSRHLFNFSYMVHVLLYSMIPLYFFHLIELFRVPMPLPIGIAAINANLFPFFVMANIATGVVNLSVKTLYVSYWDSVVVLFAYFVGIYVFMCVLHMHRIHLKLY